MARAHDKPHVIHEPDQHAVGHDWLAIYRGIKCRGTSPVDAEEQLARAYRVRMRAIAPWRRKL